MSESDETPIPSPGISAVASILFYGLLAALAWLLGSLWLGLDLFTWHNHNETSLIFDAVIGAGLGLITVVISQVLEKHTEWARALSGEFRKILGSVSVGQAMVLGVTSGVAEEMFFRGFLQQALTVKLFGGESVGIVLGLILSSLIFGMVHVGPDKKKFLPWTIMAGVMGLGFGGLYLYTGNLVAPIVAHFTINYFNLQLIAPVEKD